MSANPRHSSWSDKMPNKLRKHFERLLPKIKTTRKYLSHLPPPKQIANSTKSMILSRCSRSRTLSIAGPDQIRSHSSPQSNGDPAATLADVDRFLLENFRSLFHNDGGEKTEECEEGEIGENGEEFSYGLPRFDDPVHEIGSNQRFFASPLKSTSLFRDGFFGKIGSTFTTNTTTANSVSSSSTVSTEIKGCAHEIPEKGIAVLTSSPDPYDRFRASMIEMIQSRLRKQKHLEWGFMEELLFSYLNMNERKSFKYILCAFSDLVVGLRRGSGGSATPCKNPGTWVRTKAGDVTFEFD